MLNSDLTALQGIFLNHLFPQSPLSVMFAGRTLNHTKKEVDIARGLEYITTI